MRTGSLKTWPRYPSYRDSGVPWLGMIPADWSTTRVKYLAEYENGYAFAPDEWAVDGLPIIRIQNLSDATAQFNYYPGEVGDRYRARPGEILISWSASLGLHLWKGPGDAWVNQHIFKVALRPLVDRRYFVWLADWFMREMGHGAHGSTMQHLTRDVFGSFAVALPPRAEQEAVARFLDRRTAQIDALIEKMERLIELLEEKRGARITRAVTKGLDPDVPMKDSGVEWLGEIPAHWEVRRLKRVLDGMIAGPFGSSLTKDTYGGDQIRVYGQEQVIAHDFSVGDYFIPLQKFATMRRYEVHTGDVLVSCVGSFGRVAVVPKSAQVGIINPRLLLLRPRRAVVAPRFVGRALTSRCASAQLESASRGGTMGVINLSLLAPTLIAVPPLEEQQAILERLRVDSDVLHGLRQIVVYAIDRLREYRTALISAAVTGKIDVRDEVAA